jgi:hypothetical protein
MKNSWIKNPNDENNLMPLLHVENFIFENIKISIFGGISKFHFLANFGKFW